jgi:RNA recognition motif-containing protein
MGRKLFVGGLAWAVDDAMLKDAFSAYGAVQEAKVITDRETGRSRGFGFVTYSTDAEAAKAIPLMDGAVIQGRSVNVNEAQERSSGGGGGGARSGGYGGGGGGGGGRRDDRGDDQRGRRGDRGDRW